MFSPKLSQMNIFPIAVGDYWDIEKERIYLLYAPLNGHISLASYQTIVDMEACASGNMDEEKRQKLLGAFQGKGSVPVHYLPKSPHELYQVDILTNYICNFNCIYCYSAAGRSNKQVDFDSIKSVIDYLFCSGKKQDNSYIINFSGGGEPLLSFDLIQKTVKYIKQVNLGKDYRYDIGIVTNGSLITPEIVDFLQNEQVNMVVSFEILKRLQNKERGSYDRIAANLDMMLERGYSFGIRTTFTPESVSCMCEMLEEVARRFPQLKRVVFDVVLAPSLFPTPESLQEYYNTFLDEFYKAKSLAIQNGIVLESVAVELLSMVRDRTCEGKIVLTPVGSISACARVSSPKEDHYDDYVYGNIDNGTVNFDQKSFANIINHNNIYSQPECHNCFAKWNCGGGCRLFNQSFDERYKKVRCDFVKRALKRQLLNALGKSFQQSTGKDLKEFIDQKIKQNEL